MRVSTLRGLKLALAAAACLGMRTARADEPQARVTLETPPAIHLGDRFEVLARVQVPSDLPLLVTPTSEGTALEVVRGRLLRSDAEGSESEGETLTFRIPIVARSTGTAILRVRVQTWVCPDRCRPLQTQARMPLRVLPARHGQREPSPRVVGSVP